MAWREYVQPGTDDWWITDDAGNFLKGRLSDYGLAGTPAAPSGSSPLTADWAALLAALTGSNQQKFDWEKELANKGLYAQLAQALLSGALANRGPENWLKYAQYTQGGRNIFNSIWGNQPVPTFGAPTGVSKPKTIADILKDLGIS